MILVGGVIEEVLFLGGKMGVVDMAFEKLFPGGRIRVYVCFSGGTSCNLLGFWSFIGGFMGVCLAFRKFVESWSSTESIMRVTS